MEFEGVNKKSAFFIVLAFFAIAAGIYLVDLKICLLFVSAGLVISGAIGLKIKSYAFINRAALKGQDNKKFENFVLYMNFFLIFFGLYTIAQQIFQ
ncbi:MAG: hypothetical protein JEZ08_07875 [Clostridiales bacterium]|nr:hypothetical protein [Clostridiales bacterium]